MRKPGLDLSGRIPELDGIRGVAIGMVLIAHLFAVASRPGSALAYALVPLRLDWTGVDLLFVLSGFLIGVTWSLAVEEQFYLTLPLLNRFLDRRALLRFILFAIAGAPLLRALFFHHDPGNFFTWYTLMPCRADSLLLGVLGAIVLREQRLREWLLDHRRFATGVLGFLLAGVAFLGWRSPTAFEHVIPTAGFTWLALTYLTFLLYALLYRDSWISHCLRWRWLRGLGVIAYGTYLFHEYILGLFFGRSPWLSSWHDVGISIVVLFVTISFCQLSW